jgi:hypothetical protein
MTLVYNQHKIDFITKTHPGMKSPHLAFGGGKEQDEFSAGEAVFQSLEV